jgi:hypothetical protein
VKAIFACLLCAACFPSAVVGDDRVPALAYDPPFIISYWVGPPMIQATLKRYQEIADCGFNVALTPFCWTGGPNEMENRRVLDLCQAVGMKAIIQDSRILTRKSDDPEFGRNLDAIVATYSKHPALAGYLLRDEPSVDLFPELAALNRGLLERDPKRLPFINLLPTYGDKKQLGGQGYEAYLQHYIKTVKPTLVQWDHYALYHQGEEPTYFENLEIASRVCHKAGVPFQQTILAVPHGGFRDPSAADLRWQVYTSLCYGAKGIMYFTYWTDTFSDGGYHNAIINEKNERSEKYAVIQSLNRKAAALAPTLLKLQGLGVAHTPPIPQGAAGLNDQFPVARAEGGPLVLGWLRDDRLRDYLFVVNRSFKQSETFSLLLRKKAGKVMEISQQTGQPIDAAFDVDAQRLTVPLQAGEGRLFCIDGNP